MDTDLWQQLLKEADFNGDGVVSENEFTEAICNIIRNSLKMKKKVITKKWLLLFLSNHSFDL